jgi:phosphoglycolate phosphatase-like HAD superfamily hydrolase
MAKVVVFDFDGVIVDSIAECYISAYWAYNGFDIIRANMFNPDDEKIEMAFQKYRFLVGPAHEYYFLFKAIYKSLEDSGMDVLTLFDRNKSELISEAKAFGEMFYRFRKIAQKEYPDLWIRLNPIYKGISDIIEAISLKHDFFIASTKDEDSIDIILKRNSLKIPLNRIYGKNFSFNKLFQLRNIMAVTEAQAKNIYFVDDHLAHLESVSRLGVQCFFAEWGYSNEDIKKEVKLRGFPVVNIENIREIFVYEE